ncbi:MAG: flagellin [Gammaproteobacteria bacterium]|nr:flagellin [Gammaproteobacteria bacterium]
MAAVINTNVASLNAQRNLSQSQSQLTTSLERLSTGLRINSAKDDAAGLAISNRMTSQIRGMDQAARNANDAISLAQTGESAMAQMTTNLQRMRELSIQSGNATNTEADRKSLDAEFQQLLQENDRMAETTSFNGQKILDGSMQTATFQVGANVGETISVDINQSMRTDSVGSFANVSNALQGSVGTVVGAAAVPEDGLLDADGDIEINGTEIVAAKDYSTAASPDFKEGLAGAGKSAGSAFSIAEAINKAQDTTGVTATATGAEQEITAATISSAVVGTGDTYTMNINGTDIFTQGEGEKFTASELANAINNKSGDTGVTAKVGNDGGLTITAADGRNIEMTETIGGTGTGVSGYTGAGLTGTEVGSTMSKGSIELSSNAAITVTSDNTAGGDIFAGIAATGGSQNTTTTTLNSTDIRTVENANASIQRIDAAITQIDSLRGTFGAVQSRFESTISSLQSASENISAARSRIMDTDFAAETAAMTRAQILQQAGTAMVSQANALPQGVLSLLG